MFQPVKKSILYLSTIIIFAMYSSASAVTICAINCPTNSGSGNGNNQPVLPQIVEFTSQNGGTLLLDINGLIFIDIALFNTLPNLSISSSTPIYHGLSELPTNILLPEQFELSIIDLTDGGFAASGGVTIDYSLLRNFQTNSQINLSTPDGVIVLDSNSLFAVPLPASLVLFLSGITLFFSRFVKIK